ncbi:hypothetical protein DESC_100047 [Desulfosarcina cetonica]|nr:hypothetical protein DESC_100047 [Desulfosarcina cetonica]
MEIVVLTRHGCPTPFQRWCVVCLGNCNAHQTRVVPRRKKKR